MKPLLHPSVEDITVESILHALSDSVRVTIFAEIASSACSQSCSDFLQIRDQPIPKSTLSQHFRVLREAGLIRSQRHGVEMQNTSRCTEIDRRFPGLIPAIINAHRLQSSGKPQAAVQRGRKPPRRG